MRELVKELEAIVGQEDVVLETSVRAQKAVDLTLFACSKGT